MKSILLLISVFTLLTTTGCIFPGHRGGGGDYHGQEYRGHEQYRGHEEYREHSGFRSEPGVDVRIRGD